MKELHPPPSQSHNPSTKEKYSIIISKPRIMILNRDVVHEEADRGGYMFNIYCTFQRSLLYMG